MRIGLDIASLAYKQQVEQIVLVAGDSDFVPAAKLARVDGNQRDLMPKHLLTKWHDPAYMLGNSEILQSKNLPCSVPVNALEI